MDRPTFARFQRSVRQGPHCWLWTGPQINRSGYGKFRVPGQRERPAHVVLWEHYNGPVPDGMQLDHMKDREPFCTSRLCVNPAHLEPVTPSENTLRQLHHERGLDSCPSGHPYSGENLLVGADGKRRCRTCRRTRRSVSSP